MQEQLEIWFGPSGATAARYVIAFVVVLILLFVLRWVVRRYMGGPIVRGGRSRQPRLAVMDVAVVDARRRLVLVRRDNIEHLVMIGGPTDIVIEQTIVRGVPVGTMGRMPMRPSQAGDAIGESDPAAAAKDSGVRPPLPSAAASGSGRAQAPPPPPTGAAAAAATAAVASTAAAATGFRHAPEPVVARAADEPARAQPPVRPVRSLDVPRPNRGSERAPDRTMTRPVDRPVDRRPDQPGEQAGGGPAAEPPRRFEPAASARGGQDAPTVTPLSRATPVVTPEPARPVIVEDEIAAAVPAAPLVAPQEPSVRPLSANVPNVAPPRPESPPAFDDLARRLDEALQLDLDDETPAPVTEPRRDFGGRDAARARPDQRQEPVLSPEARTEPRPDPSPIPYVRPTRGPAARAENEAPEVVDADIPASPPANTGDVAAPTWDDAPPAGKPATGERPASVLGAASAWFRSRPTPASPPVEPPVETASVDAPAGEAGADHIRPEAAGSAAPEVTTPVAGTPKSEPPLLSRPAGRPVGTRFSDPSARSTSGTAEPAREPKDGAAETTLAPSPEPAVGEENATTVPGQVMDGEPPPAADRPNDRRDERSAAALDVSSRLADDLARILEVEPLEPADSLGPAADDDKPVLSPAPTPAAESVGSAPAAPVSRSADVAADEPDAKPSDQEMEIGPDGRLKPENGADEVAAKPGTSSDDAALETEVAPPSDFWDVEPGAGTQASAVDETPAGPPSRQTPDQPAEDAVSPDESAKQDDTGPGAGAGASGSAEGAETAPEPVIDQPPRDDNSKAPPVVAATPAKKPGSDFSSLEDEMARLLDELAGDSRSRR